MSRRRPDHPSNSDPGIVPAFFLYGEPLRAPDERTVHVETIAARSRLHDWKIRAHRHRDLHQILIVWRGRVAVQLDGRPESLVGPAAVIVPPGTVHSFKFARNTDGIVVTFAPELARAALRAARGLVDLLETPTAAQIDARRLGATDTEELATMLLREFSRSALGRESSLQGLLVALLTQLLRLTQGAGMPCPTPANRARELVGRFRETLERRYREHPGIATYARAIGASEAALRKACFAVAGQSPIEIVHARLLIEAERQLRYTGLSISEIAYFLGFEDPAYFSRFFTQRMGVTPRSFRTSPRG